MAGREEATIDENGSLGPKFVCRYGCASSLARHSNTVVNRMVAACFFTSNGCNRFVVSVGVVVPRDVLSGSVGVQAVEFTRA